MAPMKFSLENGSAPFAEQPACQQDGQGRSERCIPSLASPTQQPRLPEVKWGQAESAAATESWLLAFFQFQGCMLCPGGPPLERKPLFEVTMKLLIMLPRVLNMGSL